MLHNRITDDQGMQTYLPKAIQSLTAHGAEILAAADDSTVIEGTTDLPRTVLVRFETRELAMAWYDSPEYREALPIRLAATEGYSVLVDGLEPPG